MSVVERALRLLDERLLFPAKIRYLPPWLVPRLRGNRSVLDLGASDGRLASVLRRDVQAAFFGCDVHVLPNPAIPIARYDGVSLPFADGAFDCVMLIDVLHHDLDPGRVLAEAKRVSRRHLLIKDHYWITQLDLLVLRVADYLGNRSPGIRLPYNYIDEAGWSELFEELDLQVLECRKFHYSALDPCKQILYQLAV
jgi:SAM-dependent methyltransferase